jgi:hypothetical protein
VKTNGLKAFLSHPLVAILALVVAPVGIYNWGQHAQYRRDAALEKPEWPDPVLATATDSHGEPQYATDYVNVPGVQPSTFQSGPQTGRLANEEVIGVVVNGQPRAYLLEAMWSLKECVINDVVAGQPIAVVHAADAGVIRVLTPRNHRKSAKGAPPASPPELTIVGALEGQLYLSGYGQDFFFDAQNIPLVDYPYSRCTWRVWRRAYPESDLYTGDIELGAE